MVEKTSEANYVLIDYENVQPEDFEALTGEPVRIKVFLGPKQAKIPLPMVRAIQPLGSNVEYIQSEVGGPEALDLLIAYHIGELSSREPLATFRIISKDKGYRSLIQHLKNKRVCAERSDGINGMSVKVACPRANGEYIELAIANLEKRNEKNPKTLGKLRNTLKVLFKQLSERKITDLVEALRVRGVVIIDGDKVMYNFGRVLRPQL